MLHNAMEVLNLFTVQRPELGVVAAAELLGRPTSTVSRWLSGMEAAGFLERDEGSARYRLSMRLAAIGELARQATSLQRAALPALRQLAAATGETSNLVLLVGKEGTNVEAVESPRPIMHMGAVGRRFPLHASAAGKALLAWRPEADVRALVTSPLKRHTSTTITDVEVLLAELARVRDNRYAVNWRELEDDLVGIGAPVWDHRAEVIAAISISAPVFRVARSDLPELGGHVAAAADSLSQALGFRRPEGESWAAELRTPAAQRAVGGSP
jgi:IclR family transcriptional regulator, acetate operon repressor